MKNTVVLVIVLSTLAQTNAFGPNGGCYIKPVWAESDVQVFTNVTFGSVRTPHLQTVRRM